MKRQEILNGASKPSLQPIDKDRIPEAMRSVNRWLGWNFVNKGGKWTKVPIGKSNDSATWRDFSTVWTSYQAGKIDGVGFALGDGWAGVDLDECRNSDGELTPLAHEVINAIDSYTEISPTGTGVKIVLHAGLPKGKTKGADGKLEIYSSGRYFCITGQHLSGDIAERQHELEAVHAKYVGMAKESAPAKSGACVSGPALDAMLRIQPKADENDGTRRLFIWACRAVEQDLDDTTAIATIREAEATFPFPIAFSDEEILKRVRDAEEKAVRGSVLVIRMEKSEFPKVVKKTVDSLKRIAIFQRLGGLTRVHFDPPPCKYAKDNGAPRLEFYKRNALLEKLTQAATFEKFDGRSGRWKVDLPIPDLRNAVYERGDYPGVPTINGVICRPLLLPNGEIVTNPGYHPDSGLYVHINGEWPALMSSDKAIAKLSDIWTDFPFDSEASKAGSFAALLTLVCRNLIDGNAPFFVGDGNKSRVGKGLLTDTWCMISEGRRASRYSLSDQNELRKYLTSLAIRGSEYCLFDNLKGRFGGPVIEAAMTAGAVSDRILGRSEIVDLPVKMTRMATRKGYTSEPDMKGRTIPIRLDTEESDPSSRKGFKYPSLIQHVESHRRELLIAALSIVANYMLAGAPKQDIPNLGGYDEWTRIIRGAIVFAGLADPFETREQLLESDDGSSSSIARLVEAWTFKEPTNVKKALEAVANGDEAVLLRAILEDCPKGESHSEYLGKLLRSAKGQPVSGKKFARTDHKVAKWHLVEA